MQTFGFSKLDESGEIVIVREVVDAGLRLVDVPEDVGGDGIEAHGFGHAQAIAPVFTWDTGVVHFAGDDAEGFAIEEELAVGGAEGVMLGGRWTEGDEGEQRTGNEDGKEETACGTFHDLLPRSVAVRSSLYY